MRGIVLWHRNVGQKENEITALQPLLTREYITGRILTLDAMHTQPGELVAALLRVGCHRTGQRTRHTTSPLYRLHAAIAAL